MVAVIVPTAGDCPHRTAAWRWVRPRYEQLGWQINEGVGDPNAWCKATAVADGIAQTDDDILVIADNDCWSDGTLEALAHVASGHVPWAVPHMRVRRLNEQATEQVLAGDRPEKWKSRLTQHAYSGIVGGGIVVIRRDAYEQVPLDPRFVGWGGEDHAWGYALETVYGAPWRGRLDLFHLWHPPQPRIDRVVGNEANNALKKRYREALNQPERMLALVEEARNVTRPAALQMVDDHAPYAERR